MDEQQMRAVMRGAVAIVCKELSDEELAVLHLVAATDGSPHGRIFDHAKVSPLFTEYNGTRMHRETKIALDAIVRSRLL